MLRLNSKIIVILLAFSFLALGVKSSGKLIGVITDLTGDVKHKSNKKDKFTPVKRKGIPIHDSDWIQTGHDSWVAVKFADDGSQLTIKENTEVEIKAFEDSPGSLAKRISMELGKMRATINPDKKQDFQVATPTSVASVKGTDFWTSSNREGDVFSVLSGAIEVRNKISNRVVHVQKNETGYSYRDGTTDKDFTQPGTVPSTPGEKASRDTQKLLIRLVDNYGNSKDLIIEYK